MSNYQNQFSLLLQVLPKLEKVPFFALHGGTAINLFVQNLPRVSVDIDLTYININNRQKSFQHIINGLETLKDILDKALRESRVNLEKETLKLRISNQKAQIKIEVNQIKRGVLGNIVKLPLCEKVQREFETFCITQIIPIGQLYGDKIGAALNRQHPRDIFDIKYLLEDEGFTNRIKEGFFLSLLSSNRPLYQMLDPNFIDQRQAFDNHFKGMSAEPFTYKDFEYYRKRIIDVIHQNLTDIDKNYLLSFVEGKPDWRKYNFEKFPAVQWKLQNLNKIKNRNAKSHKNLIIELEKTFFHNKGNEYDQNWHPI